jgi:nucleoside-diphosphate-sugar epimerase
MKFFITGGAGFIGHNVVCQLRSQGYECVVIDSGATYGFIPRDELAYLMSVRTSKIGVPVQNYDIVGTAGMEVVAHNHIAGTDAIIHLASFPRQKVAAAHPITATSVMMTGLMNLLEVARIYKIPRFVYVSSSMVYGDFEHGVTEDAACNPQGIYGILKLTGERLVEEHARRHGFESVIVRPSAVYGELDVEDRVISKFMLAALRNQTLKVSGAQEALDFTHVSDTATGIVLAATVPAAANEIFNITRSAPRTFTLIEAAELIRNLAGQGDIEIHDRDLNFPRRGRLNIDAARSVLGYDPQINVEAGFAQYMQWFTESEYWSHRL